MSARLCIRVVGAREHNLKSVTVEIPRGQLTVITGPSGSGKSSLAFDTVHAEGQRRFVDSLSVHARQYLEQLRKPDVDRIEGLTPTIAIEQRVTLAGPRSTVATVTELHDYLRVLFARVGQPHCWQCRRPIRKHSVAEIVDHAASWPQGARLMVLAPLVSDQRGAHRPLLDRLMKEGFVRARVDGEVVMIEECPPLASARKHSIDAVVDRLVVRPDIAARLAESVEAATRLSRGRVILAREENGAWTDEAFSAVLSCPHHADVVVDDLRPSILSFNSPHGACPECHGLGIKLEFDSDLVVPNPKLSLAEGAIAAWRRQGRALSAIYTRMIQEFCERFHVAPDTPLVNFPSDVSRVLMEGTSKDDEQRFGALFEGVMPNLRRRWETTDSESSRQRLYAFLAESPCPACKGSRLGPAARAVLIGGKSIADVAHFTIAQLHDFLGEASPRLTAEHAAVAAPLLRELRHRLQYLRDVGVDYLTLDRAAATLSGGEFQRLRLASQIGGGLSGVCFILDEPTIGLHPRDTSRLIGLLHGLRDEDNTVVVVEHDEEVIRAADTLIDMGPGAGPHGGSVVAAGPLRDVLASPDSITAESLRLESRFSAHTSRRTPQWERALQLHGAVANNLKNVSTRIPLGCFVAVTGVSGSGKSTLVNQVLIRALRRAIERGGPRPGPHERLDGASLVDRVVEIDQSPIGRTPRGNPASYVGVFPLIREVFAKARESKVRGYSAARFSFNVRGGRCEHCEGQGVKRVAMHFLPDVFVPCGACGGSRYNRETLEIRYRGKTIADVLGMSVEEAVGFFENFSGILRRVEALRDVGLGYLSLGQAANTLSGGEAQRVKLAAELHKGGEGHTLYTLDEPTTGLHLVDVTRLITLLRHLVDRGQTVLVVEHQLDVIAAADWVIDLGPEGGEQGGAIVVEGTPEHVAECEQSHTGRYLKRRLHP